MGQSVFPLGNGIAAARSDDNLGVKLNLLVATLLDHDGEGQVLDECRERVEVLHGTLGGMLPGQSDYRQRGVAAPFEEGFSEARPKLVTRQEVEAALLVQGLPLLAMRLCPVLRVMADHPPGGVCFSVKGRG